MFRLGFFTLIATFFGCGGVVEDCGQLPQDTAVANAGCLLVQQDKLVMVQQSLGHNWSLPGGGYEPGERAACTAQRETLEETGLRVEVVELVNEFDNGFRLYRCESSYSQDLKPKDSVEVSQTAWLDPSQRSSIEWRFPDQKQLIEQYVLQYGN